MKILIILFLIFPFVSKADLYKKMECSSSLDTLVSGNKFKKKLRAGKQIFTDEQSQIIQILDENKVPLLKVYPWYGVNIKPSKYVQILNQNLALNTEFSIEFIKKDNKKGQIHHLNCKKY